MLNSARMDFEAVRKSITVNAILLSTFLKPIRFSKLRGRRARAGGRRSRRSMRQYPSQSKFTDARNRSLSTLTNQLKQSRQLRSRLHACMTVPKDYIQGKLHRHVAELSPLMASIASRTPSRIAFGRSTVMFIPPAANHTNAVTTSRVEPVR